MKFRLISHNTIDQVRFGNNDDTRDFLKFWEVYDGLKEIHAWHTKIIINGKKFNSVCFEEVKEDDE